MLETEQNAGAVGRQMDVSRVVGAPVPGAFLGDGGEAEAALTPGIPMPPAVIKQRRRAGRADRTLVTDHFMPASAAIPNNCGGAADVAMAPLGVLPAAAVAPDADGGGRMRSDLQKDHAPAIGSTCEAIRDLQRRRVFYLRRINMMDNAMRALVRRMLGWRLDMSEAGRKKINSRAARIIAAIQSDNPLTDDDQRVGDAVRGDVLTVFAARMPLATARDGIETEMRRRAQSLPVWNYWARGIAGFGPLGLAVVIGEAGDLWNYQTVSKLWKRLGLAVIDGERQRRKTDPEAAIAHGYNPHRRAEIWSCIGDPLFKHQSARVDKETGLILREPGPYRIVYDRAKETFLDRGCRRKHAHDHGMRVATKELMKDLWREWREAV